MFFRKKQAETTQVDLIWISSQAKWKGLQSIWEKDNNTVFVFWFDESINEARQFLTPDQLEKIQLAPAREVNSYLIPPKPVVFAEHYPLRKKEQDLFQQLQLKEVKVLSALDEALFKKFGGDKIIQLVKQMGMSEDQPIWNQLISKAISNAQKKLQKQVIIEQTARSQIDWMEKNLRI